MALAEMVLGLNGIGLNGYWPNWELDQVALDEMALDEMGLDEVVIDRNFCRPSGFEVMDQNNQNNVLINTVTHELLGLLNVHSILEFLGQFTVRCIYIFLKAVDNFEIEHKTY